MSWTCCSGILARDELAIPVLPDVAVRVVQSGKNTGNAQKLADIIHADPR